MTIKVTYNVTDIYVSETLSATYINVSYETPTNGGGGVWGDITGTLSDQLDLQAALDAKYDDPTGTTAQYIRGDGSLATFPSLTGFVPYTGATSDVELGEYGIGVGNIIMDTTPTNIPTEQGAMYWDDNAETVALIMNGTIQKIGEDTFYHVRNTTGSTIAKGTAVRFAGTTGNSGRLLIAPILANGTYPSQYYMGVTSEELANNQDGKVYHFGKMRGVNTSAFADGDILYVSTSVAGGFQTTMPSAPNNIIVAAAVVHANNNGTLMIRATLGSNINSDEGVLITSPTNGQVLKYDNGLWKNSSDSGITSLNTLTATSQSFATGTSGTDFNISSATSTHTFNFPSASALNRGLLTSADWTTFNSKQNALTNPVTGTGVSGQVSYWNGTNTQTGDNGLTWDSVNKRLSINTSGQARTISTFYGAGSGGQNIFIGGGGLSSGTGGGAGYFGSYNTSVGVNALLSNTTGYENTANGQQALTSNTTGNNNTANGVNALTSNTTGNSNIAIGSYAGYGTGGNSNTTGSNNIFIGFQSVGVSSTQSNRTWIGNGLTTSTWLGGNLLLGSTTDNGLKLQVTGSGYFNGSVGIGTTALTGYNLRISRTITGGANSLGIYLDGAIQNDVTSQARGIQISPSVASGTALTDLIYYFARQNTFTGTVTNQYGFYADNNLIDATNDYGFYGNIASGTGRWNLFMNGTAANYLAGNTSIGTTTSTLVNFGREFIVSGSSITAQPEAFVVIQGARSSDSNIGGVSFYNSTSPIAAISASRSGANNSGRLIFSVYNAGTLNSNTALSSLGNLLLGSVSSDSGEKLQVNGTMKVTGASTFSSTVTATRYSNTSQTAFILNNSGIYNDFLMGSASSEFRIVDAAYAVTLFRINNTGAATFSSSVTAASYNATTQNIFSVGGTEGMRLTASNRNLHIGTFVSDSGEKLQVTGTMKVTGASTFGGNMGLTLNQNAPTILNVSNTNNNTGALTYIRATSSAGYSEIGKFSASTTAYKIITANSGYLLNGTVGDLAILNDVVGGSIKFASNASANTQMILTSSGNLSLIVPTYASNVRYGFGNPARTDDAAYIEYVGVGNFTGHLVFGTNASASNVAATEKMRLDANGNLCIGVTSGSDFLNIGAGTTSKAQINLAASTAPTSPQNGDIWFDGTNLKIQVGGVTKTFTLV